VIPLASIIRRTRGVYAQIDPQLEKQARELKATCKKGCAGCCYQEVALTFAEAVTIAEHIIADKAGQVALWKMKHPPEMRCPLLFTGDHPWEGVCSVYEARPLVCRTFYVSTPPAECNPHAPERGKLATNGAVAEAQKAVALDHPMYSLVGPLALFVGHALECRLEGKPPSQILLKKWSDEARVKVIG
jgi:Fe-S-cluster containining protein